MKSPKNHPPMLDNGNGQSRNRLEIIRFASRDDCRRAIGALLERGLLDFTSTAVNLWSVRTNVVLALQESKIPFEWLTENA